MGRCFAPLELDEVERAELRSLASRRSTAQALALRARQFAHKHSGFATRFRTNAGSVGSAEKPTHKAMSWGGFTGDLQGVRIEGASPRILAPPARSAKIKRANPRFTVDDCTASTSTD
jgi:hypothetical protein